MRTPSEPTPEPFSPYSILPGTRIGTYEVRRAIGLGGGQMAYLADASDGRKVVLKVSLSPRGEKGSGERLMHERFLRQVAFCLQLRGVPGVANVFAHDMHPDTSEDGYLYMVQEWVPGSTNILDWYRAKPHSLEAVVAGWMILANACGEMDRRGICHRDLKPENVLVTPLGAPKIVDFNSGLSVGAERLTFEWASKVPGTYAYKSPELCEAILTEWATRRRVPFQFRPTGDLHALGVIFYEVLTGEHPFDEHADELELYEQIAHRVPRLPHTLNPEVPFALEKVTMKLLQKDPERRYQSGDELVEDLEALLTTDEDWERPFQTPARERHATPRPRSSPTSTGAPPLTPRSRTSGSAALDLAPSAIVLASCYPRALALVPRPVEAASAEPEAHPRRRARLLAAALALALALVVPGLFLGQHDGSFFERGSMLLGKAKAAVVAGASAVLAACVGVTGNVRAGDKDWLAKCPPEHREEVRKLDLERVGLAEPMEGPNVIIPEHGGLELRDGPVVVSTSFASARGAVEGWLYGTIRTGSDGASLRFTKFKLFTGSEVADENNLTATVPEGREFPVCAIASERGYGPDHPGIRKVKHPRRPSELHPGYMLVTTGALEIHFAQ